MNWNWFKRPFNSESYDFMQDSNLSCFVKGLIRSMKENPDKWEEVGTFFSWWTSQPKEKSHLRIMISEENGELNPNGIQHHISRYERRALYTALHKFIIDYRDNKKNLERQSVIKQFESMGCPNVQGETTRSRNFNQQKKANE